MLSNEVVLKYLQMILKMANVPAEKKSLGYGYDRKK
jgi:hypothetical protein